VEVNGTVDSLDVKKDAKNSLVNIKKEGTVENLKTDTLVIVNGEGTLNNVTTDTKDNITGTTVVGKFTITETAQPQVPSTGSTGNTTGTANKPDTSKPETSTPGTTDNPEITTGTPSTKVDLTKYDQTLNSKKEDYYTVNSWKTYQKVVKVNVVTSKNTQNEMNKAEEIIRLAQVELVSKIDANLEAAKLAVPTEEKNEYTDASWNYLDIALKLPESTDEEKIAKTTEIRNKTARLEKIMLVSAISITNATTVTFESNAVTTAVTWNGTDVFSTLTGSNPYTIEVATMNASNTLKVSASGYSDKMETVVPNFDWVNSADIAWYNDSATSFTIDTASELAGLAELVNAENNFSGKTINLSADIDLLGLKWTPIGVDWQTTNQASTDKPFRGTFKGQDKTITNLYVDMPDACYVGLFGAVNGTI
jgi:hypothetical protein